MDIVLTKVNTSAGAKRPRSAVAPNRIMGVSAANIDLKEEELNRAAPAKGQHIVSLCNSSGDYGLTGRLRRR
jgi:hypothetical protein